MHASITRLRYLLIAVVALAFSAGLAFGATPPAAGPGLANAAAHAGKTVPVANGLDDELGEDEDADEEGAGEEEETEEELEEDLDEDVESEEDVEDGANCATDPTLATPEELETMRHGSIVCWAAHQAEWPEWFSNHGAFVRCWAHQGKADAASCTEDPNAEDEAAVETTADATDAGRGKGHGKGGNGKGKGHAKQGR